MSELATKIENAWMTYNVAVVNRLHPEVEKQRLANLMINNINDIIAALRNVNEVGTVVVGDESEPAPRKVKHNGVGKV